MRLDDLNPKAILHPHCPDCGRLAYISRCKSKKTGAYVNVYYCLECVKERRGLFFEPVWKELEATP